MCDCQTVKTTGRGTEMVRVTAQEVMFKTVDRGIGGTEGNVPKGSPHTLLLSEVLEILRATVQSINLTSIV